MDFMTVSVNGDDLKRQQEENRRKIELEEEERKLEETLEYQRQIESEAKQKHLAEQLKKANNQTDLKKVTEGLDDAHPESSPADIGANEHTIASMQVLHYRLCVCGMRFPSSLPSCICRDHMKNFFD